MTENIENRLCKSLQPILELEVSLGNSIESIGSLAGTKCSFAINLKNKMNHEEINKLLLAATVESWKNNDRHYPLQSGFSCTRFHHSIAGPL